MIPGQTRSKQAGMSFWSVSLMLISVGFVAVIGLKLVPAYIEYGKVKQAIANLKGRAGSMSADEIRKAFYGATVIDDVKSVTDKDLVIEKSPDGSTSVSVDYEVTVPLMGNVSALINFSASTEAEASAGE